MSQTPNVIWITLDSVRADHTTTGGYERDTTPNLQRIAESSAGASFDDCIAHGRYTLVSSASILSGTYPSRHRVGYEQQALPETITTIAERFAESPYFTACLSDNAFVSSGTGLDRGFEQSAYINPRSLLRIAGPVTVAKFLSGIRRHSAGFELDLRRHSTAYLMNAVAKDWLTTFEGREEPFFFYLHYNEPHRPYYPPLPYLREYANDIEMSANEAAEFSMHVHDNLMEIIANGCQLSDEEWEALIALYDAEIEYTDSCIGELFDTVQDGDFGETVFVITADHGEFFGEHGLLAHHYVLDDAVINVPLVTHGIDASDDGQVQHSDVMATLLNIAGAATNGVQGVDIREQKREYAIAQDHSLSVDTLLEYNPDFDVSRYPTTEYSVIRSNEYKLRLEQDHRSLYRLPDETTDVSEQYRDIAGRLQEELTEWLSSEGQPIQGTSDSEFTDEMREHLADLGYLEEEIPD